MEKSRIKTALDRFLEKHKRTCTYWIYSGDRHCSCGRDAAVAELEEIRANCADVCHACLTPLHEESNGSLICLNETCERYGK